MNLNQVKYVYLLGIGGIGMSALARYFMANGKLVSGYDKTQTPLTMALENEGIPVHYTDDTTLLPSFLLNNNLKSEILVIYTPAVPKNHLELNFIKNAGFDLFKRSEVLGMITKNSFTIAVAGTHGKTTTSSIIAHLLKSSGIDCTAFLGGISVNYESNMLFGKNSVEDLQAVVVVEADEFDRSFLTLFPDIAIITSMDADHLDIYGDKDSLEESYRLFALQVKEKGLLFYKSDLPIPSTNQNRLTYSISENADVSGTNIRILDNRYYFDLSYQGKTLGNLSLGIPGRHNVENAVAAVAVALQMSIPEDEIKKGLLSYKGVKRRFEYHLQTINCTYIDDYAHHPEEIKAAINSVRELYPGKKITGIFQPHLYSRTKDFADGFAKSLSLLDELILLDIYPAREKPMPGVTSELIFNKAQLSNKTLCLKDDLLSIMNNRFPEVLITLGAGDIDQFVLPIRDMMLKKINDTSR